MRRIILASISLLFSAAILAMAQEKAETSDFQFKPGQSVYVMAVKLPVPRDAPVWPSLMSNLRKNGKGGQVPRPAVERSSTRNSVNGLPSSDRVSIDRPLPERTTLDRPGPVRKVMPVVEPQLKKIIEDEFLKQKIFKLADSPETADFIFFAHGEYFHLEEKCDSGGCARSAKLTTGEEGLDLNALARLRVVAVAVSDYRQLQSDIPRLFEMAKWRDEMWGAFRQSSSYQAPSAQKIIKNFHGQTLLKK